MRAIVLVLGLFGCEEGQDLPDFCPAIEHPIEVDETLVVEAPQSENSVAIWAPGPPWGSRAGQEAVLAGCLMWEPIGFTCHLVADPEQADILVDYIHNETCGFAARNDLFGACGRKGAIRINVADECWTPGKNFWDWLSQIVAHEIAHTLLFIQEVPSFCGPGIMNPEIERFRDYTPTLAITEADRNVCNNGVRSITLRTGVEVPIDCGIEAIHWDDLPIDRCAETIDVEPTVVTLWVEEGMVHWRDAVLAGCTWWDPVGVSCQLAGSKDEAEVIVRDTGYSCESAAGWSFRDSTLDGRYAVELSEPCRDLNARSHVTSDEEAEQKIERVFAHEFGHVLGVDHIPYFCADALMNPTYKSGRQCITPADVAAWQERFVR